MEQDTTARVTSPHPVSESDEDVIDHLDLDLDYDKSTMTESESAEAIIIEDSTETFRAINTQHTIDLEEETSSVVSPNSNRSDTDTTSLLNTAIIKHEKKCIETENEYASTIAICNIFNSSEMQNTHDEKTDLISDDDSKEILITDLDSLSCDINDKQEKESENLLEVSDHMDNKVDLSNEVSQSMSPNIILFDLQSQDHLYVTDFYTREIDNKERTNEEQGEKLDAEQLQSSNGCFPFEEESMKEMKEDIIFQNHTNGPFSPDFVRERKCHNSPVLHDLNDYDQIITKSFDDTCRSENAETETECDTVFFVSPNYSQIKNEHRSSMTDTFSHNSPRKPLNMSNCDTDYDDQCYDFSISDSGFFETSHISSEKSNLATGALPEFSFKMSNPNVGITKCNLNRQYFEGMHSERVQSNSLKMSSAYLSPSESQLQIAGGTNSFCFPPAPNPPVSNSFLCKPPVIDYGVSFQQSIPSYSDLSVSEPCSLPSCSEWNSWNSGSNQEVSFNAMPSSHYVNPHSHLQHNKYIWQSEPVKTENVDLYHDYLKPVVNDNDSEETEDADEFDDMPIFFNTSSNFNNGYERQWPPQASLYCGENTSGSQFSLESLTSSPSASNTPSDNGSLHSPLPLPTTYCKPSVEKVETKFVSYEIPQIPKLPFPSMADMMRNPRTTSTKSSGTASKHLFADTLHGNRFRKNQIQSDAISTSTPRGSRFKKKWPNEPKKGGQESIRDMYINLDGLEETEQNRGQRRHNEPLKQNAIGIMSQWYEDHLDNPYPTKVDKIKMAKDGGITVTQVKSWFANKRNRTNNTKPKVQKRAMEEKLKELFKDITCNRANPLADNSHIINQLSGIIQTCNPNKIE